MLFRSVVEAGEDESVEEICALMNQAPQWAAGLVLQSDGFAAEFYRK